MTACTLVLAVITCTVDPTPRPSPAAAAAILAANGTAVNAPVDVNEVPYVPPAGGWAGDVSRPPAPQPSAPARRLDGTPLSQPPQVYGAVPRGHHRGYRGPGGVARTRATGTHPIAGPARNSPR